ncbi:MAG: dTMP kinase [Patescibacteria group bacterium]
MIIEIEGIDGVGKTTQCRMLKNWIENRGKRAVLVKDLEATLFGRQMKSILTTDSPRAKETELFAFLCCKTQLFSEVVEPELARGSYIICDRGFGSFLTYFEVLGLKRGMLSNLLSIALPKSPEHVTTFLIDLDVPEALRRNLSKPAHSKFDGMGKQFFEAQRAAFLDLAASETWTIVDGTQSIESVHSSITLSLEQSI